MFEGTKAFSGFRNARDPKHPNHDASCEERGTIDHYLVRHEISRNADADGFARATGEPGVAITVPGPGASTHQQGILEAFTDCALSY